MWKSRNEDRNLMYMLGVLGGKRWVGKYHRATIKRFFLLFLKDRNVCWCKKIFGTRVVNEWRHVMNLITLECFNWIIDFHIMKDKTSSFGVFFFCTTISFFFVDVRTWWKISQVNFALLSRTSAHFLQATIEWNESFFSYVTV